MIAQLKKDSMVLTSRSILCEERQHMNVHKINGVEDILGTPMFLIPICHFADSDRYMQTGEI